MARDSRGKAGRSVRIFFWRNAWRTKREAGFHDSPIPLSSFANRATHGCVIYGSEGYRQYLVETTGELILFNHRALPEATEQARLLAFRLG